MSKTCEICGRTLRTGRKYCYSCKQGRGLRESEQKRKYPKEATTKFKKVSMVLTSIIYGGLIVVAIIFRDSLLGLSWFIIIFFVILWIRLIFKILKSTRRKTFLTYFD